ncbi:MAG: hypothetical protein BZ138_06305, partial [Methanosphaera sp. rholeuAM270]
MLRLGEEQLVDAAPQEEPQVVDVFGSPSQPDSFDSGSVPAPGPESVQPYAQEQTSIMVSQQPTYSNPYESQEYYAQNNFDQQQPYAAQQPYGVQQPEVQQPGQQQWDAGTTYGQPYGQQPDYTQGAYAQPAQTPGKGLAIAAFVLGIITLIV